MQVLHNQSLLDIAIQHTGSVENAFAIAAENGISISDIVPAGTDIVISSDNDRKEILSYYQDKKIKPATSRSESDAEIRYNKGIKYWEIGNGFKVS